MSQKTGLVEELGGWDEVYKSVAETELPWNAGGPDSDLVRLVGEGKIPKGRVLDLGVGPGHDAAFLAKEGYDVYAIDISSAALNLARKTANAFGVEDKIKFMQADVLDMKVGAGAVSFVYDRGCFHVFKPEQRPFYIGRIHRALKRDGKLLIRTFSDKVPPGPGPHRFTKSELLTCFESGYELEFIEEGIFEGPRKPEAWLALFRKKD